MSCRSFGPRALLAFSLACATSLSLAQTAGDPATIVITAARTEQPLPDALPSTRVITRAEIDALQPADLPGLLRELTSIDVAQSGPMGSQTSLFLRGADSRQTLVLVDGVPMQRADFGTASWQNLPIDQIERVEIVRGNLSSLYGAQAIGGVVQIITRQAQGIEASMAAGSQGASAAAVAGGTRLGSGDTTTRINAGLSARRTDGYSARNPAVDPTANPDRDPAWQTGANALIEQNWAPGQRTQLNLLASRTQSAYDGFTPGLNDVLTTHTDIAGLHSQHALGASLVIAVDVGQTRERFVDPTGYATAGNNLVHQAGAQVTWQTAPAQQWQLGAEARRERFSDSNTPETSRQTDSVRVGWLGHWGDAARPLQLQADLRNDHSSAYGSATTGLLALAYNLNADWKASVQWSSAFSAPSFVDEQYANPATPLRPERSHQFELAMQWSSAGTLARVAGFAQRQRDRIAYDPQTFVASNIARAKNDGLELMLQAPVGPGRLGAELTLQDPLDLDSGLPLKLRARQSVALNYSAAVAGWQSFAALRFTGRRLDTAPVTFGDAYNPARTTLGLGAQRQLTPTWRLAIKLDNAGDSRASELLGYAAPPRSLLVSLQARLR